MYVVKQKLVWSNILFFSGYHLLLLIGMPIYLYYFTPSWAMIGAGVLLYLGAGLGITMGYHRLYAHRTYKARPLLELPVLFFGTLAIEGSALTWSFDHRRHHTLVDTDDDPYAITKGFWFAHCLWLFTEREPIKQSVIPDLMKRKLLIWQHKYYVPLAIVANVATTLFFGWLLNDYLGAFMISFLARMFLMHHSTFFINSLAHYWGSQSYSREHTAVDNYVISLLTFGEGYHNYHHTFAGDYRNGVKWYHFDPGKWLLWLAEKFNIASDLRTVNKYTINRRLISEDAKHLLDRLKQSMHKKRLHLEKQVQELSARLTKRATLLSEQMRQYQKLRASRADRKHLKARRFEIKLLRRNMRHDWRAWTRVCRAVYKLQPAP